MHVVTGNIHADGNDISLVNLGPIVLGRSYKLKSSGKQLEAVSHALNVSLMFTLVTSTRETDDLSIGFDRDR